MTVMKSEVTEEEIANVVKEIKKYGLNADVSRGEYRTVIGIIGHESRVDFSHLATLPGVKEARMIETPYRIISKEYSKRFGWEGETRVVQIGSVLIAGPCAVESKQQLFQIAERAKKAGAHILRAGVFKPWKRLHYRRSESIFSGGGFD